MELRCPSRLHGVVIADGHIEVKCSSGHCGARSGVTVLHYFDLLTGELLETKKFNDPKVLFDKKEERVTCP